MPSSPERLVTCWVPPIKTLDKEIHHIPLVVQNHAALNAASFMVIDIVSHENVMEMVGSRETIKIIRRGMVGKGRR